MSTRTIRRSARRPLPSSRPRGLASWYEEWGPTALQPVSRLLHLCQVPLRFRANSGRPFSELCHADLTFLERETGLLRRGFLVQAQLFPRLSPSERKNVLEDLEDFLIFTPGDSKSIPPEELHLAPFPRVHTALLRDLWNATLAYHSHSD